MASIIKIKRSDTATEVPGSLEVGEIAVNLFDRKLYVGNSAGVTAIGGEDFRLTTDSATAGAGAYLKLLGDSVLSTNTVLMQPGEGIDIVRQANGTLTFSGEDASTSNKGVASFDSGDFSVTSGAVSLADSATGAVIGINGTANEVNVSRSNGTVTVGLPDDVTVTGQLNVGENVVATGNGSFGGAVSVTGGLSVDGASALNGVTATSIGANGNVTVGGTLGVTGASTLSSTLTVTGQANFNGGINADSGKFTVADTSGNVSTAGTLNVDGGTTLNDVSAVDVTANGNLSVSGTSTLTGNITASGDLTVAGDTHVDGSLTVEGSLTYISTSTVYTDDGMMKLGANNAADTVDSGIYGKYVAGATTKYAGYFRDASDGIFKFYKDTQTEPTTTVDTGGTGYTLAQIDAVIDGGTY